MKLKYEDIINKHKGKPCVVALHGPSLDENKDQIEALQKEKKIMRLSVNEWFDFFKEKPDYWVAGNGEFTIQASIIGSELWKARNYPPNVFNYYNVPLIYCCTADLTDFKFIDDNLICDYLPFDARHFKSHTCKEILYNFKDHYKKNKNLDYYYYGNNKQMWQKPNVCDFPNWFKEIHGRIASGWPIGSRCCDHKLDITFQEKLQQISGHAQHMAPGQTIALAAVCFAVFMGCNPIYISGLDLDCSVGYAHAIEHKSHHIHNIGNIGHWKIAYREFLLDNMRILNESAKLMGISIINLNKDSWHNEFIKGKFDF
jgi:hypothetical protein